MAAANLENSSGMGFNYIELIISMPVAMTESSFFWTRFIQVGWNLKHCNWFRGLFRELTIELWSAFPFVCIFVDLIRFQFLFILQCQVAIHISSLAVSYLCQEMSIN